MTSSKAVDTTAGIEASIVIVQGIGEAGMTGITIVISRSRSRGNNYRAEGRNTTWEANRSSKGRRWEKLSVQVLNAAEMLLNYDFA